MSIGRLAFVVVWAVAWLPAQSVAAEPGKRITVVFRYDDYGNATSRLDFDAKLIAALREHGVPATFSVIPFERKKCEGEDYYCLVPKKVLPLGSGKLLLLADAIEEGLIEVALHGYLHREVKPGRPWTEFAGVALAEQERRIAAGKFLLDNTLGTPVTLFVPPFNSYDGNTIRVLEKLGFQALSAGGMPVPAGTSGLRFLPVTCERILDLRDAVESARGSAETAAVVVAMLHPHDFREVNKDAGVTDLQQFRELLQWVSSQKDVQIRTLGQVVGQTDMELGQAHYRDYCRLRPDKTKHLLPPPLRAGCSNVLYYPSPATLRRIKFMLAARLLLLYGGIAAVSFAAACAVLAVLPFLARPAAYGGSLALAGVAIYVCRDFELYFRGVSVLACAAGLCAAGWCWHLRRRAKTCPTNREVSHP